MTEQRRPGEYPAEMRARAVRMVREGEAAYGSEWEAICAVAEMLGPTAETVRKWVVRRGPQRIGERQSLQRRRRAGGGEDPSDRICRMPGGDQRPYVEKLAMMIAMRTTSPPANPNPPAIRTPPRRKGSRPISKPSLCGGSHHRDGPTAGGHRRQYVGGLLVSRPMADRCRAIQVHSPRTPLG